MNQQLEALIAAATEQAAANRYPGAKGDINGHTVEARIVGQFRRSTARAYQQPSVMWTVDGKRIAKADLAAALA